MPDFDPTSSVESWHPIPSLPGVELSNRHEVRRWVTAYGNLLPAGASPIPVRIHARSNGRKFFVARLKTMLLHRAIAEVRLGRRLERHEMIRHLDDIPTNNDPANLALGSHQDNVEDAIRNGRLPSALTGWEFWRIWELHVLGWTPTAIARELGRSRKAVGKVIAGKARKDLWRIA